MPRGFRLILFVLAASLFALPGPVMANSTLTAVDGLKVGHFVMPGRPTGCTVIVAEKGATAGVDVRGGAPGTRETDLLNPVNMVQQVHAVVLSGGSAFGLEASIGVVRFLEGQGIGFDVRVAKVPIVVSAILFDLGLGDAKIRPNDLAGYYAAQAAAAGPVPEGNVGAGAGATVGKLLGPGRAMKAGLGSAAIALPNGLVVAALVAVNAVGDILDPTTGKVLAGARTEDGKKLQDIRQVIREGKLIKADPLQNTTIGVVATNAKLTKTESTKLAQMAHDGLARTISPIHTPWDGDTIFALSTGTWKGSGAANLLPLGAMAAEVMSQAVVRAALTAQGIQGYPAARDLVK